MVVPTVTLNNGYTVPAFGLGTWKSKPGEVTQAVCDAIDIGYRHFDCAYVYQNEKEVGEAIKKKISEGVVKREDLFIVSKLWNTFHRPDLVEKGIKETLSNLGLEYLDLYLIHWPMGYKEEGALFPSDESGKIIYSDVDYADTWKEMEKLIGKNYTKSIGLSNFNKRQIERILSLATVKPAMLQIECHPYLNQKQLIEYCKAHNIAVTGYSPLGSPDRPWAKPDDPVLLEDPKLKAIADKYKKSVAQILLKYQLQRGVIVIPKSVSKKRLEENINIFDFVLSEADIATIDTFDCKGRVCAMSATTDHKYHPFANDDY